VDVMEWDRSFPVVFHTGERVQGLRVTEFDQYPAAATVR
jgi:hypothetical protein